MNRGEALPVAQPGLFDAQPALPEGMRHRRDLLSPVEERALLERLLDLPLRPFEFHGFTGNRRVISFGWRYDFNDGELRRTDPIPGFLLPLRKTAAAFADIADDAFQQVLVTEYRPGAAIGWHRDRPEFAEVVGISLLSSCRFRLRRKSGTAWQRAAITLQPRSVYLLSGAARRGWEHSIPGVESLRYSITFRTLRGR